MILTSSVIWWRPVADGLPDSDTTVMVALCDEDEPVIAYHDGERWIIGCLEDPDVTHWAHLPELPSPFVVERYVITDDGEMRVERPEVPEVPGGAA